MSGGGGDYTAGYRYLFSLHMGICRGPVDEVVEIRVGDRTAWTGSVTGNTTRQIDAYDLFGGESGEGGVQGPLEFMFGEDDQLASDTLGAVVVGGSTSGKPLGNVSFDGHILALLVPVGTPIGIMFLTDGTGTINGTSSPYAKWLTNAPAATTVTDDYEVRFDLLETWGDVTIGGTYNQWLPMTGNQGVDVKANSMISGNPYYAKFGVSFRKDTVVNPPVELWLILEDFPDYQGGA